MYKELLKEKIKEKELENKKIAELELINKQKTESFRKKQKDTFTERFKIFFDFINSIKNNSEEIKNVLSLFSNTYKDETIFEEDKNYVITNFHGINISAKPMGFDIIESLTDNNKIYLGISLVPKINLLANVTWTIEKKELCSFVTAHRNLKSESFKIPASIYFGLIKRNKVLVEKNIYEYYIDKYYYAIEIEFDETKNEYIFKSMNDRVLKNSFYFSNLSTSQYSNEEELNVKIKKDELEKNKKTIINDLLKIFIGSIKENEILKSTSKKREKFTLRPFDLNNKHWDKPYSTFGGHIINSYPRYIASQLQENFDIKEFNKECIICID